MKKMILLFCLILGSSSSFADYQAPFDKGLWIDNPSPHGMNLNNKFDRVSQITKMTPHLDGTLVIEANSPQLASCVVPKDFFDFNKTDSLQVIEDIQNSVKVKVVCSYRNPIVPHGDPDDPATKWDVPHELKEHHSFWIQFLNADNSEAKPPLYLNVSPQYLLEQGNSLTGY